MEEWIELIRMFNAPKQSDEEFERGWAACQAAVIEILSVPEVSAPVLPPDGAGDVEIFDRWLKSDHIRLHAGEMTAQELRSVKAVLNAVKAEVCATRQPSGMLDFARRLDDIAVFVEDGDMPGWAADIRSIAQQIAAIPPVRGDREIPPVERIECVKFDDNFVEVPAEPCWRLEINGICADFPTQTWANIFRNAILSLPVQYGAGERGAISQAAEWCRVEREKIGAVDGYDYRSGEEFGLRRAQIELERLSRQAQRSSSES